MDFLTEIVEEVRKGNAYSEEKPHEIYKSHCLLHDSAFNALALWSDPNWTITKEKNSLYSTALSEWVQHQRIWIAVDKITVSEIIGSVKGVIPSSKLASYGEFRYDLDVEEMYNVFDGMGKKNSSMDDWRIAFQTNKNRNPAIQEMKSVKEKCCDDSCLTISSLNNEKATDITDLERFKTEFHSADLEEWILKCQSLLQVVKRIVFQEKSFDVWCDALLKTCCKFLSALRSNASLLEIMESDVPLLTDYKQLLTEPISMLELLSLPRPYLNDNLNVDVEQEDALWLKLSSPSIKSLWGQKQFSEHNNSPCFDSWLETTNFLRRQRQKKSIGVPEADIEISEAEARELVGSLFNIIENHDAPKLETTGSEGKFVRYIPSKNYFPEAHGDWTRTLFPRRINGQNETNTDAGSSGNIYFHHQTDLQALYKQTMPPITPPAMFPPPLYVPPPTLPNILNSAMTQKLPFFLPPINQLLQTCNYERVHFGLPLNYIPNSRSSANNAQQSLSTARSFSLQHAAGAGFHVQEVNKYYSRKLSNSQTNVANNSQAKQIYGIQDNSLTRIPMQFYPANFTSMNKSVTHHNGNFIKEVVNSKSLPNISSRISAVNKLSLQLHESYQHNLVHTFKPPLTSTSITKGDFPSPMHESADLKQFLENFPGPHKVKETKVSTQNTYKRTPLVTYNHQRSPVIEKLRKDLSTACLFKQDLSYGTPQKVQSEKWKQNSIIRVETQKKKNKDLLTPKQPEIRTNGIHLELSDISEQFNLRISSQNEKDRNNLVGSRKGHSKFLSPNLSDNVNYLNSSNAVKMGHMNYNAVVYTKLKLTERKKNWAKRSIRFDHYKIMLLLAKNLKRHSNIDMDSIHKCIWDYLKLHRRDSCLIKECFESNKCSIILNYRDKTFTFQMSKNDIRRSQKILRFKSLTRLEVCKNEYQQVNGCILYFRASSNKVLNKKSGMLKDDYTFEDQKVKHFDLVRSHIVDCHEKNSNGCVEDKELNVEFLNRMTENLFFGNEVNTTRSTNIKNGKINGWTYFKIAIEMIVKKASQILMKRTNGF